MGASEAVLHGSQAPLALTQAQHGIWLGQQVDPASAAYLTAEAVELTGTVDADALCAAVRDVLAAVETLHQRYHAIGDQVVQVADRSVPLVVPLVDLSHEPDAAADRWVADVLSHPVDLAHGPLFGTAVLRLSGDRHRWFLWAHHIVLDGFGHALVAAEVARRYRERTPPAPVVGTLAHVVDEDLRYQASAAAERDRAFWLAQLAGAGEPVSLAPVAALARGVVRCRGDVAAPRWSTWHVAAAAMGVDDTAWLVAAVAAWLHGRTGATDLTLGLPVMNRLGSQALRLPCMAMNIVPLRLTVDPAAPFAHLVAHVAARLRAVRPHQRYRYERLRDDLRTEGGPRRPFGPVVNLMPFERPLHFGAAVAARSLPVSAGPVEDLSITIAPRGDSWQFDVDANPNAYTAGDVAAWRGDLLATLDRLAAEPAAPLADTWRAMPAVVMRGEPMATPAGPVLDAFAAMARERTGHPALEHDGRSMTYGQLHYAVQALAGHLATHGVGEGARVVVLLPRSMQAVTVLLSVLWAGGGYVPIDPDGPPARLALVLADARPDLVVTLQAHAHRVPAGIRRLCLDDGAPYEPPMPTPCPVTAQALAYVIYTSGSTGRPNGVMVERTALANFIAAARTRYGVVPADRVLQFAPLHFDASVEEIFLPLTTGATLVLRTDEMIGSMAGFGEACGRAGISVLDLPTAFWHELALAVGERRAVVPDSVRLVVIGGEAALVERVAGWRRGAPTHTVLLNTYGPTETTVICATAVLAGPGAMPAGERVPIGSPIAGVDLVVVDDRLRPVPAGVAGELCVLGGTLAAGYLGNPERTAARFAPLGALDGAPRAYRTGDQVSIGVDGQLRFLGRRDDELKISGHRIDPSEIEAALHTWPSVTEAAVVPQPLPHGGVRLVAFVVLADGAGVAPLRAHVAERVAAVAVPTVFVSLDRLPRNANNKIDRGALKRQPVAVPDGPAVDASELEHTILAVWHDVLGASGLSPASDFFALGGKSLQAIQVANRLGAALRREVHVALLFRNPTVSGLARALADGMGHAPPPLAAGAEFAPLLAIQPGPGPVLFCVHPAEGLSWCYFGLSRALPGHAIAGVQANALSAEAPATFDTMVDQALATVRARQSHGPYRLLGWSSGGGLAQALAVRLQQVGEQVWLGLMDAYPAEAFVSRPMPLVRDALEAVLDVVGAPPVDAAGRPLSEAAMRDRLQRPGSPLAAVDTAQLDRLIATALHTMTLYRDARHDRFHGDVLFFRATRRAPDAPTPDTWAPHVAGQVTVVDVDSTHSGLCQPAPLAHIGRVLADAFSSVPA